MAARTPEDLDRLFAEALNAGNLDAIIALYEPQAALTPPGGKAPVIGHVAIREVLAGFVAGKPRMTITPRLLSQTGELALISAQWQVSMTGQDGKPMQAGGQSVEVARRQPDGRWLFVLDVPGGTAAA